MTPSEVRAILLHYRRLQATYRIHAALHPAARDAQAAARLRQRLEIIAAWLHILKEEERFVVTRHLLDRLPWPLVTEDYARRWGQTQARSGRTLKKRQQAALTCITRFVEESEDRAQIEALFADISDESPHI